MDILDGPVATSPASASAARDGHHMHHPAVISHRHSMSQDSNDSSGSSSGIAVPPTYNRLPPDGHEFPPEYKDTGLTKQVRKIEILFFF